MPRRRGIKGEATQGDRPDWEPLVDAVGGRVASDFMWMYEVELSDGRSLQVYKHVDTRRSVHLAADGQAYYYEPPDRYVPISAAQVFAAVFRTLPGLLGVTEGQILDSRNAVDRLYDRQDDDSRDPEAGPDAEVAV
jgi:hypothetical protein